MIRSKQAPWRRQMIVLLILIFYFAAMCWLHYQQLYSSDGYASDLPTHIQWSVEGTEGKIYSATSLLLAPLYNIFGMVGVVALLAGAQLMAVVVFAWGLCTTVSDLAASAGLLLSLAVNLSQAVWIPRGGYWYLGTVSGTNYHNTTYIMLAPFALLAALWFYRAWAGMRSGLRWKDWLIYTLFLTTATAFKASFVFAFAPSLLILLIVDLVQTRGRNLKREILMGCSVLPSIVLCLLQSIVLFGGESEGLQLIFTVDWAEYPGKVLVWGLSNEAARRGLIRSFVFIGSVAVLLGRTAWNNFRYRFSFLTFCIAMAEALLLVESGERIADGNLWWGPFICYWILLLESFAAFLCGRGEWKAGRRAKFWRARVTLCGAALVWHLVSGICFLVLMMQGNSYIMPIATWQLWPF